jgi:putative transposase
LRAYDKGAWRDNVLVERLWRRVKYEEAYLHDYDSVSGARTGIGRYLDHYNRRRPHSSLDDQTPDQAYFGRTSMPPIRLAAQPWQTIHLSKRKICQNKRRHFTI